MYLGQKPLVLLHLSDLHCGAHSRFQGRDASEMADRFSSAVKEQLRRFDPEATVQVVLSSGDLTEQALPDEFAWAKTFFERLSSDFELDRRRFLFLPGNHDVSWIECKRVMLDVEEQMIEAGKVRDFLDDRKLKPFEQFLVQFYGASPEGFSVKLPKGGYVFNFDDLGLSVAALNSCERESHRAEDHLGELSEAQSQALMNHWQEAKATAMLKVVAVHHNPTSTIPSEVTNWVKFLKQENESGRLEATLFDRFASDAVGFSGRERLSAIAEDSEVQLILHGHDHAAGISSLQWKRGKKGATHILAAGSWGLRPDKLPHNQPNAAQIVILDSARSELRALRLIYDPGVRPAGRVESGHFISDPAEPGGYVKDMYIAPRRVMAAAREITSSAALDKRVEPLYRPLPDDRRAVSHRFSIDDRKGFLTVGLYEDGSPGEIFLSMDKEGSTISGLLDTICGLASLALQHGMPVNTVIERLIHVRFEPSGFTKNPEIPIAKSISDYVARWLKSKFVDDFDPSWDWTEK